MRILILALILTLVGWIGGGSWYWVCKVKGHCEEMAMEDTTTDPQVPDSPENEMAVEEPEFSVSYQDEPMLKSRAHLRFPRSGSVGVVPEEVDTRLNDLSTYIKDHPDTDIEITGLYGSAEENDSEFSNLGLGRADYVANLLEDRGVESARIIKSYSLEDDDLVFTPDDTLLGGINLRILDRQPAEDLADNSETADSDEGNENARQAAAPKIDPRNLYFDYNSSNLSMNNELRDYISKAIQYLNQHPEEKLLLTGHTDSMGSADSNKKLGLDRARTVKKYFEDFGLASSQISITSQGQADPIATNDTDDGRSKNRRVEVSIQ